MLNKAYNVCNKMGFWKTKYQQSYVFWNYKDLVC